MLLTTQWMYAMQMPPGIPDYSQFMQMTPAQRKNLLKMLKFFNGKQMQPLLMVVYEKDPDPEVRQAAREMLESQGVQIRVEGDNLPSDAERDETPEWMKASPPPVQRGGIGIPVTDDLSRRAAEALKRGQGTPQPNLAPSSGIGEGSLSDAGATIYYTTESGTFESPFSGPDTISGGDGRPMQRNQNFPQVFLLHRKNEKYVRGEAAKPTTSTGNAVIGFVVVIVFFAIFFVGTGFFTEISGTITSVTRMGVQVDNLTSSMLMPFIAIFGIVFLIMGIASYRNSQRMSRLASEGKLLIGQALMVNGRWVSSGSGKNRSSSYKVTVSYTVKLPDGRAFTGQETATRGDLARKALPMPGTPVALLYVSDEDKLLL